MKKQELKKWVENKKTQDISKSADIQIIGMREEEEKQETENLFEKVIEGNFPYLLKEIDIQVQEAQSPKQDVCKEAHSNIHHN